MAAIELVADVCEITHPCVMDDLHIAEILFEDGGIQFRYSRKLSADGTRWLRHGLFRAYYPDGSLASEGTYLDGVEDGEWRDYHENGHIAADGRYSEGTEIGVWQYWNPDGSRVP